MDYASRLLHPAIQSLLLGLLALLFIGLRHPRKGLALGALAIGWIWLASTPVLALALRGGLVGFSPPAPSRVGAIVVLGGGKLPRDGTVPEGTRAGTALRLWHEGRAPLLLVSGRDQANELARRFRRAGVPADDLRVEGVSANTHENARDSAAILKANGVDTVALVSSDIHLRRAAGCFRREGIGVVPVAAREDRDGLLRAPAWLPRRDALTLTARSLHEYVALWFYRRRGWL
ncbi:YdcF family protein [Luteibacter sp. CQ10]|uniref:YdcF family protein n=1 Tax=Luteibacter sp. CQ10 TaxID=2805821 RepID=UPI0034A4D60A